MRPLLIDALRRSGLTRRSLGFILLYVLLNVVFPAAAFPLLLRELLGLEHVDTRQVLVVLAFTVASLAWLFVQVVLDRPMNLLLDLRPLLSMPIGFGTLYRFRVGLSLTGMWCILFGPAAVYVMLARSAGMGGAVLFIFGVVSVVLIHGQIGSILQHWRERLIKGWLGSILVLGCLVAAFFLLLAAASVVSDKAWADGLVSADAEGLDAESLRTAWWFKWASWMPFGMIAPVVEEPRVTGENLMRVSALWSASVVLGFVDRGLLARLIRGGRRSVAGGLGRTLPLAWLLRKLKRLSSARVLSLIECESVLRERSLRWPLLVGVAILIVTSGEPDVAILVAVLMTFVDLNSHRAEPTLPTGRIWKESFSLPMTLLSSVRAMGRVPSLILAALLCSAVLLVALRNGLSLDWVLVAYVACIAASVVIVSDGFYGWYDVRWQAVGQVGTNAVRKMLSHGIFVIGSGLFGLGGFVASRFGFAEVAPGVAMGTSLSAVVLSIAVWRVFRVRQARLVREGGLRFLMRREAP